VEYVHKFFADNLWIISVICDCNNCRKSESVSRMHCSVQSKSTQLILSLLSMILQK